MHVSLFDRDNQQTNQTRIWYSQKMNEKADQCNVSDLEFGFRFHQRCHHLKFINVKRISLVCQTGQFETQYQKQQSRHFQSFPIPMFHLSSKYELLN